VAAARKRRTDLRVLAVNDAHLLLPEADLLYACDARWWDHHKGVQAFEGERWTQTAAGGVECAARWGLNLVEGKPGNIPDLTGSSVRHGGNSGFQAVNLAALQGVRRIILLGFDMGCAPDGRRHFFGNHADPCLNVLPAFRLFVKAFTVAAPVYRAAGVEILNASRRSALTCFPSTPLEPALA
jgi:hypothetical protein